MEQSTKLFIVLGFMFLLYITMKGNLKRYLGLLFGKSVLDTGTAGNSGFDPKKTLKQIIDGL